MPQSGTDFHFPHGKKGQRIVMNSILQDLSPSTVSLAIDANKIAYGTLFSTLPQAALHDDPGILWFETGVPLDLFNGVLLTDMEPNALPEAIDRVLSHFQQRRLPFHWHVGPSSRPASFGHLLQARGITHEEDEPGMAVDLLTLNEDIPAASSITIHPVTTDELLQQWVRVWGCTAPEEVIHQFFTVYSGLHLDLDSPLRLYLGTRDGKPVATVGLFFGGGVASVEHVVTLPHLRQQGIGGAMTLMAAREARTCGYRLGVLTASPMGINIYRRIGFRECCTCSTYQWNPSAS